MNRKTMTRLGLTLLLAILTTFAISAQNDTQGDIEIFSNAQASSSYMMSLESVDNEFIFTVTEDTVPDRDRLLYNLEFSLDDERFDLIQLAPAGVYDTAIDKFALSLQNLLEDNEFIDLYPVGELLFQEGGTLQFRLYAVNYDGNDVTLTIDVMDYSPSLAGAAFDLEALISEEGSIEQLLEDEFLYGGITLYFVRSVANEIISGRALQAVGLRALPDEDCNAALAALEDLRNQYEEASDGTLLVQIGRVEQYIHDNQCL